MNAHTPVPSTVDVGKRIEQFVKLRAKINEIKARHKEELAPYNEAILGLEKILLGHFQATGSESATARGVGTAYVSTRRSATIADQSEFRRFIVGGEHYDLVDWKANASRIAEFLEENQSLPPGINYSTELIIGVRKA